MFVELKMFTKFNIFVVYLVACKYEEIQKIINVLSCHWQSHCGKNYVLIILLYCNGSHQGISISSSPRQAIFGNVISRFSVFVFFVGLAYNVYAGFPSFTTTVIS